MTTLIIGCGYLGERLGALLCQTGEHVIGTVRSPGHAAKIGALGIDPIIADVLEPDTLSRLPSAEGVFHCVGYDRAAGSSMRTVYVNGLQNVLNKLPGSVRRFVYASSTGVYGQTGGEWVDERSPARPVNESGKVCLEAEERVRAWTKASDGSASAIVLRFAGLYGPGRVVRRAMLERGEPIPGDPDKFLNLIHIDDAAGAAVAALTVSEADPIYVIADDRPITRREYYSRIATLLGVAEPRFELPRPGSLEASRDESNKRIANHRMKAQLIAELCYPDISTGLPAALDPGRLV